MELHAEDVAPPDDGRKIAPVVGGRDHHLVGSDEADAEEAPSGLSPALAAVLLVAAAGTVLFGVYPRLLFELADASAATLGAAPSPGLR